MHRFEVHAINLGKTVSGEIDDGLCLLNGNIAEQRLMATVGGRHIDEQHLREHLAERSEPQQDRPADVAGYDSLIGGLDIHGGIDRKLAEARSPGVRQSEIRRTGVDQGFADNPAIWVRAVLDSCFDDYSTHVDLRNEFDTLRA